MAFAFGDWGSVLTESAFSRAFICLQSDSRVSRSDTRWGFFPILFNLRINTFSNFFTGNFKPKDPPCLFTHGLFLVWLLVYNLDFATKGGWINTHIFSSTCAEFLYLCLLWFTQGLKFFKLLLLCGDYRGYGCIGQSTENGIPGLRSRLPFAIYSQSKFHWSSLANIHLKNWIEQQLKLLNDKLFFQKEVLWKYPHSADMTCSFYKITEEFKRFLPTATLHWSLARWAFQWSTERLLIYKRKVMN